MCRTAAERTLAAELNAVRPDLTDAYAAGLPGARSAVLTRLWRGLVHEPLPWVAARTADGGGLTLRLADGRRLRGPFSDPWATVTGTGPVTGAETMAGPVAGTGPVSAAEASTAAAPAAGAAVKELDLDGRRFGHPAELMAALAVPGGARLAAELDHSVASMALSRTAPRRPVALSGSAAEPWEWEQTETDGHPYHPCCRSRPGFSAAEQLAYAPEHRPVVSLWLAPVEGAAVSGAWPAELRDGDAVLIPVHPWQAAHVLRGRARGPGPGRVLRPGPDGHPLLSLRTLDLGGGTHVKTALSTRLTSAVRDISAYTVTHALATSEFVERLAQRFDGRLHIARTLAAAGAGTADLAALLRESPQVYADAAAGERVVPVAALPGLLASHVPDERLCRAVGFARLALGVGLELLDLGVALEAHGQNLLVVLDAGCRPRRLVYRDLADIRISPARLARHGIAAPPVSGRLLNDDPDTLRRKLLGSLVTGALGPLAGDAPTLGTILDAVAPDLPPTPDAHALRTEPLPAKALTLMRLEGRGGDRWTLLPRPS
ncbi:MULTISPECIES: IucA/IucC family siderophore biosynthesis protein [unclassified Streptomyces]|uniref:IucA/IucC family protein n=1 Tax=unclassified Streptomyces TaxID=2593676 RepID=UPI0006FAAD20|nr:MULTISPECIES: IucA/IucC family siderophore biosynthesis protein [unclassified Streptomyces]KQX56125.1 iron transporter [Streptomyces sp. Root1304]KRA96941.1 iron transporter [Streptomyces sp. Root66D1]